MFVEECNKLGFVFKVYGIKGELIIRSDVELSENIIEKWESIFVKINGILVPFFIEDIFRKSDKEIQLRLEDITDETQAKPFLKKEVYIEETLLQVDKNESFFSKYIGYTISNDEDVVLGEIVELLEYPGQDLLKVDTLESDSILIPAIADWIISCNDNTKELSLDLPEGLIDINRSELDF